MSAWAQLVNADGSDEHLELCNAALVEIQTEYARRLAEKLRTANWAGEFAAHEVDGVDAAVDFISAEVTS
ncbi:hypothetical protein ACFUGD_01320 [Streptomyces sp. NPDC057217]|uniref:hypothetical protein n=1 Tax=Streptomyces sp. NPDC057217 TaxID=3346054 RepID=UPI00362F1A46